MSKNHNLGSRNSSAYNSVDLNTGNENSGHYNSGNLNSGNNNSGNHNSGNHNSGEYNSGAYNSGNYNSGEDNSGHCNSGNRNSGNGNSGHDNSGSNNSGNYNSGNYNSGDYNSSNGFVNYFCNTKRVFIFNKEVSSDFVLDLPFMSKWPSDEYIPALRMTQYDKINNPNYKDVGGFIQKCNLSYKQKWSFVWTKLSKQEKQQIIDLPNFDADIFFEITGIYIEPQTDKTEIIREIEELEKRLSELKKKIS